ncbi:hypothetical protein PBY51_006204 [Eleginops maclovinus]|uniref:Uncharacterized protein n=1 Tax=Eleginops maclovinus TaxID=56733 RepID=A0AAN7WWM5_ELEMC|nr:hypothetical protein PBY51_006204 [Eleginops maclovinus]
MPSTRELYACLTFTAMMVVYHCKADPPPPPENLTFKWLDPFFVSVSWLDPRGLKNGEFKYKFCRKGDEIGTKCRIDRNFTDRCFTEHSDSDNCTFEVWTVGSGSCDSKNESERREIKIQKIRAKLEEKKCIVYPDGMNCSWNSPRKQRFNFSYGTCEHSKTVPLKPLTTCDQPYSGAKRSGCYLKDNKRDFNMCIYVETEAGLSTFKPEFVIPPPELSITEGPGVLQLDLEHLKIGWCYWNYTVCYTRCNKPEVCESIISDGKALNITYDKDCLYQFRSRAEPTEACKTITSNFSKVVAYGSNKTRYEPLTVVAIVIPIILSACIILSCYCFRKHSAIICPVIPDPSAIFKEMMINGNKEHKTSGKLYTPVPEPIEPCIVTLVAENGDLQQNS